jgi:hypothetical protein
MRETGIPVQPLGIELRRGRWRVALPILLLGIAGRQEAGQPGRETQDTERFNASHNNVETFPQVIENENKPPGCFRLFSLW